jgi:hypothetical protein
MYAHGWNSRVPIKATAPLMTHSEHAGRSQFIMLNGCAPADR